MRQSWKNTIHADLPEGFVLMIRKRRIHESRE